MATIDKDYLISKIQNILDKIHTHPKKKQIIKNKSDRISFACPICGDSHKNPSLKRGHLFLNNLFYKCYNEDCRSTFTKLCSQFSISIDSNMKMDIINYIDTQFHLYHQADNEWFINNFDLLLTFDELHDWFDSGKAGMGGFKKVEFGSSVYVYLLNRGIPKELIVEYFYEAIYYNGKYADPYVIFINQYQGKILGMQYRNLKSGMYRKFKIWSFKELYDSIKNTDIDPIEIITYNKLSYLFNILNIDFEKTITVFEGYLDSIFMPNSVGAVGINTDYSVFIDNDLDVRFLFDNDDIGKRKSDQWLKKGYSVFLWEKYIDHLSKKYIDTYKFKKWFNNNIKDMNKLMKEIKPHYTELNAFFSKDISDTLYLKYDTRPLFKQREKEKINIHTYIWKK